MVERVDESDFCPVPEATADRESRWTGCHPHPQLDHPDQLSEEGVLGLSKRDVARDKELEDEVFDLLHRERRSDRLHWDLFDDLRIRRRAVAVATGDAGMLVQGRGGTSLGGAWMLEQGVAAFAGNVR